MTIPYKLNCNNFVIEKKQKGLIKYFNEKFELRLKKRPQNASKYT